MDLYEANWCCVSTLWWKTRYKLVCTTWDILVFKMSVLWGQHLERLFFTWHVLPLLSLVSFTPCHLSLSCLVINIWIMPNHVTHLATCLLSMCHYHVHHLHQNILTSMTSTYFSNHSQLSMILAFTRGITMLLDKNNKKQCIIALNK